MKNKYIDLVEQSFEFPQDEFRVEDGALYFHDIPMMDVIGQYGTPLKISYLLSDTESEENVQCRHGKG